MEQTVNLTSVDMRHWANEEVIELLVEALDVLGCYDFDNTLLSLHPDNCFFSLAVLSLARSHDRSLAYTIWKRKQIGRRRRVSDLNVFITRVLTDHHEQLHTYIKGRDFKLFML
jgi:hypothetical protein